MAMGDMVALRQPRRIARPARPYQGNGKVSMMNAYVHGFQAQTAMATELRIDPVALSNAVNFLARSLIEKRKTIPILSCLAIIPGPDGSAIVMATDLDIEAAFTIPAQWENAAPFVLPAEALADFLAGAGKWRPDACIRIYGENRAEIRCGRAKILLENRAYDDFPMPARCDATLSWECSATTLSADFARLAPAISKDDTRYYLQGVCVDTIDGDIALAATDGHRLHIIRHENPQSLSIDGAIIPHKTIGLIVRQFAKSDAIAKIEIGLTKIRITAGNLAITSKLIDGTYPDWRRVIPQADAKGVWSIAGSDLQSMAAMFKRGKDGNGTAMGFDFSDNGRYGRPGVDGFALPLPGEYVGDNAQTAYNSPYLVQIGKLAGVNIVNVEIIDNESAARLIIPAMPELRIILMPLRGCELAERKELAFRNEIAAPGQAVNLFGLANEPISAKPRKATALECKAYMLDYAARRGFNVDGMAVAINMDRPDGICIGATFGDYSGDEWDSVAKKTTPRVYQDGAFSIAMPGASDPLRETALLSIYDEDSGQWSDFDRCQNAKGEIALPDAPKDKKQRKAPAKRKGKRAVLDESRARDAAIAAAAADAGEAGIAIAQAPIMENAPQGPLEGQGADGLGEVALTDESHSSAPQIERGEAIEADGDPVAARLDALMARIAELESIASATPISEPAQAAPAPLNDDDGPGTYAMALSADIPPPPISGNNDRAKRERAARAYLRMRQKRTQWRAMAERMADGFKNETKRADDAQGALQRMAYKRRRAILNAKALQQRLYDEYKLADKRNENSLQERIRLSDARDQMAAKRERAIRRAWEQRKKARAKAIAGKITIEPINQYLATDSITRDDIAADQMRYVAAAREKSERDAENRAMAERIASQATERLAMMEKAIEGLEKHLLSTLGRAVRAETALAAIEGRLSAENASATIALAA